MQFQSYVSDDWNNAAVTRKEVKRKRLNLSPCKQDLGGWSCSLFSREVYPTTTVAQLAARRRGLTRTGSCSLARYNKPATSVVLCTREVQPAPPQRTARYNRRNPTEPPRQTTSVALCISEVPPQRTAMYNSRIPTDSSIIDSVALQDDGKPDFYDDTDAAMDLSGNPVPASTGNKGSHTIEFYALGRSSPHDFHGIMDKWEIPP